MNVLLVALISSSAPISTTPLLLSPSLRLSPVRVLPQSARWLIANDKRKEAIALLKKAALVNGRVLPPAVQVWVFRSHCVSADFMKRYKTNRPVCFGIQGSYSHFCLFLTYKLKITKRLVTVF